MHRSAMAMFVIPSKTSTVCYLVMLALTAHYGKSRHLQLGASYLGQVVNSVLYPAFGHLRSSIRM